jgi:hypothetical protein
VYFGLSTDFDYPHQFSPPLQRIIESLLYIDNLKGLVAEYLATDAKVANHRSKRAVLNFIGEISEILFGVLTRSGARRYNKHISELDKEQKEVLHLAKEQMMIIKATITSVNSILQRVNQNESFTKWINLNYSTHEFHDLKEEIESVNLLNETLIEAFVHAEQETLQPWLVTVEKIRNLAATQKLPTGLDYPNFPFPELSRIITPNIYSYKQYLVYIPEISLFSATEYHWYKVLPFPVKVNKKKATYGYINFNKEFIFSDSVKQHYGKMTINELTGCFQPNEMYVCMYMYVRKKYPFIHMYQRWTVSQHYCIRLLFGF